MNLSGRSVLQLSAYFSIPPQRIIVLFDDISLPPGRLRIRPDGSAGGHNGIKSIIAELGSQDFPRVKIGVGAKPHPDFDLADWVLSKYKKEERPLMEEAFDKAAAKFLANAIFFHNTMYPTPMENFILSAINWTAGVIFAYFTNRKYVFKSHEPMLQEIPKFVLSRVFTLVLDIVVMITRDN
mgnify:CR=1 FL=1